jgi:hypothetical protein
MRLAPFFCRRRNTEKRRQAPAVKPHQKSNIQKNINLSTLVKIFEIGLNRRVGLTFL